MSRRGGAFAGLLAFGVVAAIGAGAVVGVLWLLNTVGSGPAAIQPTCTATGDGGTASLRPEQAANAALIAALGDRRDLSERAVTIAIATAMQESSLRNLDHGDRDSLGLFQQRPSQGWGSPEQVQDPVHATDTFYDALLQVPGFEAMDLTVAAQTVQRSGFPEAYAKHEPMAQAFAAALTGRTPGALTCVLRPVAQDPPGSDVAAQAALIGVAATPSGSGWSLHAADEREAWALASWAVATATRTGALEVRVADRVWSRADGDAAVFAELTTGPRPGTGDVFVLTAVPEAS